MYCTKHMQFIFQKNHFNNFVSFFDTNICMCSGKILYASIVVQTHFLLSSNAHNYSSQTCTAGKKPVLLTKFFFKTSHIRLASTPL